MRKEEAMIDCIDDLRLVLDEIAFGNEWGGPDRDHIAYMRGIAFNVLEHGKTDNVF